MNVPGARWLVSAIPNPFEASNLIETARIANPSLQIIARAHNDAEVKHLTEYGANLIIVGEREIARGMIEQIIGTLHSDGQGMTLPGDAFETARSSGDPFHGTRTPPAERGQGRSDA